MVRLSTLAAFLVAAADISSTLPLAQQQPSKGSTINIPSGYSKIVFQDDFAGLAAGSRPSPAKWTIDQGTSYPGGPENWGTNEIQTYTSSSSNLAITDSGTLRITPVLSNGKWTSARIETTREHDFAPPAGKKLRVEARLRVLGSGASHMGIWPAFWSLGAAYRGNFQNWPTVGEIDVLETLNGLPTAWHTVHCGPSGRGGPCDEPNGVGQSTAMSRGEWHVVAFEVDRTAGAADWRRESLAWFLDGSRTFSLTGAKLGDSAAWASLAHNSRFLLLNVAVGGAFPDAVAKVRTPTAQTAGGSGAQMEVDYVAVFST